MAQCIPQKGRSALSKSMSSDKILLKSSGMQIYRPPNSRNTTPSNSILNVHAKEFTMNPVQVSKSFSNSKLKTISNGNKLQRSKSMMLGTTTTLHRSNSDAYNSSQLGSIKAIFSVDEQDKLRQLLQFPESVPSHVLIDLVQLIMHRVINSSSDYYEAVARFCARIIVKETTPNFIETLLNTCQHWYQERELVRDESRSGNSKNRFCAFIWFLTELSAQLKRHYQRTNSVILFILLKCCQALATLPIRCVNEMECLFFVLATIGPDLQEELPQQLDVLLIYIRNAFLANDSGPIAKRTLLQLIELHASSWQLTGSSVLYYYPRRHSHKNHYDYA